MKIVLYFSTIRCLCFDMHGSREHERRVVKVMRVRWIDRPGIDELKHLANKDVAGDELGHYQFPAVIWNCVTVTV